MVSFVGAGHVGVLVLKGKSKGVEAFEPLSPEAAKDVELRTQTKYVTDKIRTRNSDRVIRPFDRDVPDERDRRI